MATKLGSAIAAGATQAPAASRFMAALSGRRALRKFRVPVLEIAAAMTLVGTQRSLDIEGDVLRAMAQRGLEQGALTEQRYELERAIRHLAEAVIEDDAAKGVDAAPLGTAEEWGKLPPAAIADLWSLYGDLCEEHDPLNRPMADEDIADIRDAIAKKNGPLLRYFGVRRLASYLLTSGDPLVSSSTAKSSPGLPSQESNQPSE